MRRHRPAALQGMTLVEVLFAFVTVAVTGVWVLGAYHSSMRLAETAQQNNIATDHLKTVLEQIKATPFSQLTANFPVGGNYSILVGGFTLPTATSPNEQITVTHVPNANADPRELVVRVAWTSGGRSYSKTMSTVRASRAS